MKHRKQHGATLVGMSICLAVIGILLGQALPAMNSTSQHQRLRAETDQLHSDLQELRQLAFSGGRDLRLHVENACYLVHDGAEGDCRCDADRREAVCQGPAQVLKIQWTQARLDINTSKELVYRAAQGTVTPTATVRLRSAAGEELRQIIAITGRVRGCSVNGGNGLPTCET